MIDRHHIRLIRARQYRLLQIRNIPNICRRPLVRGCPGLLLLIQLIVHQQELLVLRVQHPPLVRVRRTLVRDARDDLGVRFIGDVVDGERVLVVAVADLDAVVARVGPAVDEALGVMDVAVGCGAAGLCGVAGVGDVDEDEAGSAGVVAGSVGVVRRGCPEGQ